MRTDYKFWFIRRDDNGFITECGVRFYEGDYQTIDGKRVYVRQKRLNTFKELKHLSKKIKGVDSIRGITDESVEKGDVAVLYYPDDFGVIKTDDELCAFLNAETKKDTKRVPVEEQKI